MVLLNEFSWHFAKISQDQIRIKKYLYTCLYLDEVVISESREKCKQVRAQGALWRKVNR